MSSGLAGFFAMLRRLVQISASWTMVNISYNDQDMEKCRETTNVEPVLMLLNVAMTSRVILFCSVRLAILRAVLTCTL